MSHPSCQCPIFIPKTELSPKERNYFNCMFKLLSYSTTLLSPGTSPQLSLPIVREKSLFLNCQEGPLAFTLGFQQSVSCLQLFIIFSRVLKLSNIHPKSLYNYHSPYIFKQSISHTNQYILYYRVCHPDLPPVVFNN